MSDSRAMEYLNKLTNSGKFFEWFSNRAKDVSYEALQEWQEARKYVVDHIFSEGTSSIQRFCEIARIEAEKNLVWTDENCEAEKYLASVRPAIGQKRGRFPWCGAFVYWCAAQAGLKIPAAFPTGFTAAYVPGWEAWAKANKTWYSSRLRASEFNPKAGDIVIFDWDGDSVPDHIGIVLSYDGKRTLKTAEGNTSQSNNSNGNSTSIRTRDWNVCKGFIRMTPSI
jgi:hypothetical protein